MDVSYFTLLSLHSSANTLMNHENSQSGKAVPRPRFKPGTSTVHVQSYHVIQLIRPVCYYMYIHVYICKLHLLVFKFNHNSLTKPTQTFNALTQTVKQKLYLFTQQTCYILYNCTKHGNLKKLITIIQ